MRKILKDNFKRIAAFFVLIVLCVAMIAGGQSAAPLAYAAETMSELEFDYTDVLDDLEGSTDGAGNVFDIKDYPKDENGELRLHMFTEYGYSYAVNARGNYALYVYIYNPAARAIDISSGLNTVQIAVSYDENGDPSEYEKFTLKFCNRSTGDYNHLFYKFRVIDHASADGKTIAERVDSAKRKYVISGVEFLMSDTGKVEDSGVGGVYTFEGYAAGYGEDINGESTLKCSRAPLETVELDVQSTYYRYPTSLNSASQVVSAYFAIDNELIEKYGELYAIAAEYYEYVTAPLIVTRNEDFYNHIYYAWLGKDIGAFNSDCLWGFYHVSNTVLNGDAAFNYTDDKTFGLRNPNYPTMSDGYEVISKVVNLFYSGGENADDYFLSSEDIEKHFEYYTQKFGSGTAYKGYNNDLFSGGAGYQRIETTSDDLFDLEGFDTGSGFWNFWYDVIAGIDNEALYDIEPIRAVTADDLRSDNLSNDLLIAPADTETFTDYCDEQMAQGKTVFLFRYDVSEYTEDSGYSLLEYSSDGYHATNHMNYTTDVSIREQTVYLGFDIISLTFKGEDGTLTVLPVVADPIDVIPDSVGMGDIIGNVNGEMPPWWVYVIVAIVLLVVLWLLRILLVKLCGLPSWIYAIFVLAVVLTIPLYITPLAQWVYALIT